MKTLCYLLMTRLSGQSVKNFLLARPRKDLDGKQYFRLCFDSMILTFVTNFIFIARKQLNFTYVKSKGFQFNSGTVKKSLRSLLHLLSKEKYV